MHAEEPYVSMDSLERTYMAIDSLNNWDMLQNMVFEKPDIYVALVLRRFNKLDHYNW